ncbi:MAG: type II toxin-antitoxin system Phd/YefM family antitoxin [Gemmataceae bacterium]|nr:type II toxin-antitoxin system Phd/YefM family antitoxin [Gemmataceae bacterium]
MKTITVERFSKEANAVLEMAQSERVVVTRNGKPLAVVLGLLYKDEEDYALERDLPFWEMIRERRLKNKTIPWEEVKRELGLKTKSAKNSKRK